MARNPSPRQRISVACPHCGHRQDEPQQVISTLCRRCRSHFEVAAGKVVVAPHKDGPALGPSPELRPEPPPPAPAPKAPPIRTYKGENQPPVVNEQLDLQLPPIRTRNEDEAEIEQPKPPPAPPVRTHKEEDAPVEKPKPPPGPPIRTRKLEDEPPIKEPEAPKGPPVPTRNEDDPLPPGSSASPPLPSDPKPPSPIVRIREALRPKPPQRDVLCIECGREFTAPTAANATNCPSCGAWLNLADFEINEPWEADIVTRGNVIIRRRGSITESVLQCHNLLVEGHLIGAATCTGSLVIRRSGMIRGKIRCGTLRIERRAKVQFIQPVEAGETVINGRVIGSIRSTSTLTLLRRSQLRGNITTTELITKRGAKHVGRLRIAEAPTEPITEPSGS